MKKCLDLHRHLREYTFFENYPSGVQLKIVPSRRMTHFTTLTGPGGPLPVYINEFWTSRQRQAASLHEISYRACFKPQLPRFFIELLTEQGDNVYDPFSGRGTTVLEAALLGRNVISNDVNPLSGILCRPRLSIPDLEEIHQRLLAIPVDKTRLAEIDLSMFFHRETLGEIVSLQGYLQQRSEQGLEDTADQWIRMVATNRLTGHSRGFFSVYTLPPNQAASAERQKKINRNRRQEPEYRDTRSLILRKSKALLKNMNPEMTHNLRRAGSSALFLEKDARDTPEIADNTVQLTVTSPPFLDVVQYSQDNWLRCWFNAVDAREIEQRLTVTRKLEDWTAVMAGVFSELFRVTRTGGWVAFEVGEVRSGTVRLEEHVIPLGLRAGFTCEGVLINQQDFTKTSNIWGINNNRAGTNTNRVVLFRKVTRPYRQPASF